MTIRYALLATVVVVSSAAPTGAQVLVPTGDPPATPGYVYRDTDFLTNCTNGLGFYPCVRLAVDLDQFNTWEPFNIPSYSGVAVNDQGALFGGGRISDGPTWAQWNDTESRPYLFRISNHYALTEEDQTEMLAANGIPVEGLDGNGYQRPAAAIYQVNSSGQFFGAAGPHYSLNPTDVPFIGQAGAAPWALSLPDRLDGNTVQSMSHNGSLFWSDGAFDSVTTDLASLVLEPLLPRLPCYNLASDMTADGTLIVGTYFLNSDWKNVRPVFWTKSHQEWTAEWLAGADEEGVASAVSPNGRWIGGYVKQALLRDLGWGPTETVLPVATFWERQADGGYAVRRTLLDEKGELVVGEITSITDDGLFMAWQTDFENFQYGFAGFALAYRYGNEKAWNLNDVFKAKGVSMGDYHLAGAWASEYNGHVGLWLRTANNRYSALSTAIFYGPSSWFPSAPHGPLCASTAATGVSVVRSGYRLDRALGQFVQQVTITNTGPSIAGPVSLVLDELSPNATLANATSVTSCATPAGSSYINMPIGTDGVLSPGESVTVTLHFTNPTRKAITYVPRVLTGPNGR